MNLLKVDTIEQVKEKLHPYFFGMSRTTEEVPLFEAVGRYLAEDLMAPSDIPETDRSVVDGYALKASETFGVSESSPAMLELIGEGEMGKVATHLVELVKAVDVLNRPHRSQLLWGFFFKTDCQDTCDMRVWFDR